MEPPALRYLVRDSHGDCRYGVQKTFLDHDDSPRVLTYESVDPCPQGNAEHRWVLTTGRYVLTFPDWGWGDEDMPMLVLDEDTLGELRRGGPFESDMFACAVGDSELWVLPGGPTVWVVDLETLEVTGSFQLPSFELPDPIAAYLFFGGCASDGDRAFVCAVLGAETGSVFEVRLADHSLVDQDPLTSGVQGFPLPNGFECHLVMDAAHSRLFVALHVGYPDRANSWELLSIDLTQSGATEPRLLLPGDRSHVSDLHPVVLPGGDVFALLEQADPEWVPRKEWIRIDPESGGIVSLREADYDAGTSLRGARALPAVGDWIVTLVPPRPSSSSFGFEYFNAMTGETGPSLFVDDEGPLVLFPLPPRH